jgi:type VI secretion system secreted protein Hcp
MAQVDYFIKLDGIKGESEDAKHKGEIDIESWSWGQTNAGSATHGGGSGAGKVQPQDLHFTKRLDASSPLLAISCATGKHIKEALLTARKAGEGQQDYLQIKLEGCFITSYQTGGSAGSDIVPLDQVGLSYEKLEMIYKTQKVDGSLGPEVKQKYDYLANKKV